jgi:DNA-binding PadR family transcriptional regulator
MSQTLGEFELMLLLAIVRLGGDAYGVNIRRAIQDQTGRNVSAGAMYTTLGRLETRGLVSSREGETTPERTGRRRRYYKVRTEGARQIQRSMRYVETMARGLMPQVTALADGRGKRRS